MPDRYDLLSPCSLHWQRRQRSRVPKTSTIIPRAARVEYVFGCLKANGETRQAIEQCSCSIDIVASLVPYERYVTAETVLSMSQVTGNLGGQFRTSEQATSALNDLRRAQAEAEVRCF